MPAPPDGRRVRVGDAAGRARGPEITWPVSGAHARTRGDLPRSDLLAVAAATRVASGRPAVDPPPGLTVVSQGPARPARLLEARYSSKATGESGALSGGLTFTGVARCGGLEDGLHAAPVRAAGTVRGRPAVLTSALGGNGALAWEPAPAVVAYVGYSGAQLDERAVAALRRPAERTRLRKPGWTGPISPCSAGWVVPRTSRWCEGGRIYRDPEVRSSGGQLWARPRTPRLSPTPGGRTDCRAPKRF
ncbi:hypothetical protein [Streptomyces hilarionis]|uniref:hypothetical protein n=1 Tax=Streptomyces hilarionis TaxID=2839954 RepID=UPI00211A6F91|nr:hypothetical protein [Streptomyces hilarionis]MCQ9129550.1 hypothetical protein [Streptomyces hilarionis]